MQLFNFLPSGALSTLIARLAALLQRAVGNRVHRRYSKAASHSSLSVVLALLPIAVVIAGCAEPAGLQSAGPQGELHEEIRIGGPDLELIPIRRLAVSSRGDIAIGQEGEELIILADSDGNVVGRVGRPGEGPGEFTGTPIFNWIGDSLFVGTTRLTVFSRLGSLIRTQQWNREFTLVENGIDYHPFMGTGILLSILPVARRVAFSNVDPVYGTSPVGFDSIPRAMVLTIVDTTGDIVGTYGLSSATVPAGCSGIYCPRPLASVAAEQELLLTAMPIDVRPDSISYSIALIGVEHDDILFDITRVFRRVPIPKALLDSMAAPNDSRPVHIDAVEMPGTAGGARSRSSSGKGANVNPTNPVAYQGLGSVLVGSDSTIWLERMPSRIWEAMDRTGHLIGYLKLPERTTLRVATRHKAWVVQRDSLDVPTVIRYGIRWKDR